MYKNLTLALIYLFTFNVSYAKKEIPVEYFNHLPIIQSPTISPDGKTIAVIFNQDEETQVALVPFSNPSDFNVILKLESEKARIHSVDWANNEKLIVLASRPFKIDTNKTRMLHLYSVGLDGKSIELISPSAKSADSEWKALRSNSVLSSILYKDHDHILVESADERDNYNSSIFKVNVNTGKYKKYLPNGKHINYWGLNRDGHILFAVGGSGNSSNHNYVYVRDDKDAKWENIKTIESYKTDIFSPIFYDNKNYILYVYSNHKFGKDAIWTFDTKKKEFIEMISNVPGNLDVTSTILSYKNGEYKLAGYNYYDDVEHSVYFDESNNSINRQISELFAKQGLNANVVDYDDNHENYIVSVEKDSQPTRFMLFNNKALKFTPWFSQYPNLVKHELAEVEPITFKARDGMQLHGYYTVSKDVKNPPLVVFPHGGPDARDYQSFNPFVQLFASRGYAVLQVNFRGSTGYGLEYETAGYNQWGGNMQTDLVDAFNWVKEHKQADTNKSCIVGFSYGGYAALVAGFQTPNMYKCIASFAGVSDLDKQISHWRVRGGDERIFNTVNDHGKIDTKAISPINHVNNFKAPVLLIHGDADTRVDIVQSENMHEALKNAGKKSKFVSFKYGTHNLSDAVNLKVTMIELDEFLKKHLK